MFPSLPYRQVHLDFHTSEHIPDVGKDFNKKDFQTALKKGNVDSITLFAKCHHGWCYYPTKVGKAHPHLVQPDLLGLQMEACREIGVATPAYVTVQWDEKAAREHPEWRVVRADNPAGGDVLKAQWHPLCLSNPGAVEQVIAHAEELIERYHPPGFFFDILLMWECVCPNCVAKMQADGRDAEVKADRIANHRDWVLNAFQRISAAVWKKDPQCRVYLNAGIAKGEPERWANFSHLELESLPTGGWGWDHFPLAARYAATQGKEYLGMSGKFHTTWGELGGYKTSTSLEFECASMVAQGARCSIGDQLHPSGRIDLPTYERLGPAYERVRKLEPYAKGARNVSQTAGSLVAGRRRRRGPRAARSARDVRHHRLSGRLFALQAVGASRRRSSRCRARQALERLRGRRRQPDSVRELGHGCRGQTLSARRRVGVRRTREPLEP